MAKTQVILTHNIVGLGGESDQVKVAAGYARNFLFPQGLAIPVTAANKRRLESLRQKRAEREAHDLNTMTELGKSLSKVVLVLKVKTGDDGKMFGSVTPGAITDELKHQLDVALDKRKIHIDHPIRTLGDYEIELRLHPDVQSTLKLKVESTTPPKTEEPASGTDSSRKEGGPRGRGDRGDKADRGDRAGRSDRDRDPRPEKAEPRKPDAAAKGPQRKEPEARKDERRPSAPKKSKPAGS